MRALIIRLPEEKRTRLKLVAKSRKVSVTKLFEEMATILLADFDAETRLMCVAPLVNDAEVQRLLQSAVAGGAALVERRSRDGISAGEIPSVFPIAARATQVTDLARALTMRAQLGTPRKTLLKDAVEAADLVLLPRRV
jgi:hypothetical protein